MRSSSFFVLNFGDISYALKIFKDFTLKHIGNRPMLKNVKSHKDLPHFLFSLLSTSGTLAGLSLALVGIVNLKIAHTKVETIADDMFLISSVGFFAVCYIIFFTLRQHHPEKVRYWTHFIDVVFLSSMTLLVMAGFVVVYTFL